MAETTKKAVSLDELSHFKAKQDLLNANTYQKKGETDLTGAIRYDTAQVLTDEQKAQARANIGAGTGEGGGSVEGAVLYNAEQALDEDDKARARDNIGTTDGTWEAMPDKPFGESGYSIGWDGVTTEGLPFVELMEGIGFYKVSEKIPTKQELIGATFNGVLEQGEEATEFILTESHIMDYSGDCYGYADSPIFLVTTQETDVPVVGTTLHFTAGTWFVSMGTPTSITVGGIKKIDKKFLPDDIGVPENVVTTDESGLIPASVLPSYVDDVVEGYYWSDEFFKTKTNVEGTYVDPITPEQGKIYVDLNTGDTYRWSGSQYVQLNPPEITFATTSDIDELFN